MRGKERKKLSDGQFHTHPGMSTHPWERGTSILPDNNLRAYPNHLLPHRTLEKVPLAPECRVGDPGKCRDQTPAPRLPHHLNSSLRVSIYKVGSLSSGSKLSGHKRMSFLGVLVVS